jgi:hypothetical protein
MYLEISPDGHAKDKGFPIPLEKILRKKLGATYVVIAINCDLFSHFWGSTYKVSF